MLTEAVAGGALLAAGTLAYAVRGPSSALLGPSIHRGPRDRPAIALTFDDGPSESTPDLLEVLDRYRVPATFFQCGANVRRLPRLARQIAGAGHEIGNHTDSHPMLQFHSPAYIRDELARAQQAIEDTTGVVPALFRAPYGVRWFGLREAQQELHLLGVMWTIIGRDWKEPADCIAGTVLRGAAKGAIVCLHDGRILQTAPDIRATVEAVRRILPILLEKGYQFQTVSQLLCPTI
ncbi:MAG TPA: polysaccharide deacetylase family protein [Bryobacteraceae bacterium]|nr:polysaccharide deacetylase family protein [Bryobacteraceae bacterium]